VVNLEKQVFLAHRLFDALTFTAAVNTRLVITCDACEACEETLRQFGTEVWSLERRTGRREAWTSKDLPVLLSTADLELDISGPVVSYLGFEGKESNESKWIISPAPELLEIWNDKTSQQQLLSNSGLKLARGLLVEPGSAAESIRTLGWPLIMKPSVGSSGIGIKLVTEADGIQAAEAVEAAVLEAGYPSRWEEFISGTPANCTGVVFETGVRTFQPSIQFIGEPLSGDLRFGYGGNAFGDFLFDPNEVGQCEEATRRIGEVLRKAGYLGLFGVDVILHGPQLVVCEVNPRFQNSTAVLNAHFVSELQSDHSPAKLHIDAFNYSSPVESIFSAPALDQLQLILQTNSEVSLPADNRLLMDGVYHNDGKGWNLRTRWKDIAPATKLRPDEALLCCLPPLSTTTMAAGSTIAKVIAPSSGWVTRKLQLDPTVRLAEFTNFVRSNFSRTG
jgi:predicted ATP-grasp superfamily ATP-dependent carboligase